MDGAVFYFRLYFSYKLNCLAMERLCGFRVAVESNESIV